MVDGDRTEQAGAMTRTPPEAPSGPPADDGSQHGGHHDGPHDAPYHGGPRVSQDEVRNLGRIRRSAYDRKVAGVAGGLARHFDIDPIILRVAFVVLSFFGGAGLIVYGACWILVPDERTEDATIRLDERSRTVALSIVGLIAALALIGDSFGGWGFPWPLAIIGLVVLAVMAGRGDRTPAGPRPTYAPPPYGQPPYGQPGAPAPQYGATAPCPQAPYVPPYVPPIRPRNPRRRGPILFWFTLALIALGLGVLGTVDLAGTSIPDSAYPALALGITGVMLLVGAFFGRAGGLIALGVVAALATAGATAAGEVDGGQIGHTPQTAIAVDDRYHVTAGEIVLDLTQVEDLEELDGRTIELDATFGRIDVIVPQGLDVDVDAVVDAAGHTALFGDDVDGSDSYFYDGGPDAPLLRLEAEVTFGEIEVDLTGRNN
ncbi:phage shock protein C (PspC) family protein [Nocardioides szechwanensis]|uniref:Phage shock protein C (PspC) family protein n=2 Tax=Nocardioides szechwanensis TaxID=1005944 RepID=A0A1H0G3K5_9ACTN|nr:phage shock protein C (PspC) family protein [Nocardioides szechwanensis]